MQAIVATAVSVGAMDALWLSYRYAYHNELFKSIQNSKLQIRILPSILIYALIPYAIYIWAIKDKKTFQEAAANGAIVGLILYGFYDLTNYATFNNWTLEMAITDTLWGTTVCALGAAVGFYFHTK